MFDLWRPAFTRNQKKIPSLFLEQLRLQLSRMMDMHFGGVYDPESTLKIFGKGIAINPLLTSTINGIITRRGSARFPNRIERLTITTGNVTARSSGVLSDLIIVDATGSTADRELTVDVTAASEEGELVYISVDPAATFDTRIKTTGVAGSLFVFGSGLYIGDDPEWCALWFDPLRTGTNPDGEWALLAHGAT